MTLFILPHVLNIVLFYSSECGVCFSFSFDRVFFAAKEKFHQHFQPWGNRVYYVPADKAVVFLANIAPN